MTRTADDARRDPKPGDLFFKDGEYRFVMSLLHVTQRAMPSEWRIKFATTDATTYYLVVENFIDWASNAEVRNVAE